MKSLKYLFIFIFFVISIAASAQRNNVETAKISLRDGDLKDAKKYIDLAAAHEETKNNAKMWLTRGDVYFAIAIDTTLIGKALRLFEAEPAYKSLESYINCIKTGDVKLSKVALDQIAGETGKVLGIAPVVYNEALIAQQNQIDSIDRNGFATSIRYFELILSAFPYDKENKIKAANTDLTENTVVKNIGKIAYFKKDWALVTKYLGKLAADNFLDEDVYITLSKAFQEQGDTVTAIKYVEQGRDLLPEKQVLIDEELALFSLTNQGDKLIEKLSKAIEGDASNAKYYYYRAITYEGLAKNDTKLVGYAEKAEADYLKSLELEANNLDVNIRLGIMYFNKAVPIINERESTDNIKQKKKFDDLNTQANLLLNISLKYYQAANAIKADDIEVLTYMKLCYAQLGDEAKVLELGKTIKLLEGTQK